MALAFEPAPPPPWCPPPTTPPIHANPWQNHHMPTFATTGNAAPLAQA